MSGRRGVVIIFAAAFFVLIAAIGAGAYYLFGHPRTVDVPAHSGASLAQSGASASLPPSVPQIVNSPLTGLPCANMYQGALPRPIGSMLSGDTVARPLSGIADADVVIEMPVITDSINRMLAIFQCTAPGEIGSVRSSRDDFIPLAAGFDAIYGHWGGSHFALDQLNRGIINNIDALRNPYGAYFRKTGIPAPHNGFTSWDRLWNAAQKLGYRLTTDFAGYSHVPPPSDSSLPVDHSILKIGYPGQFRVEWRYDPATKTFLRFRGGTPEIDRSTKKQVRAGSIAVLRTNVHQIEGQYNDVRVVGSGEAKFYRYGQGLAGTWKKSETPLNAPLEFVGLDGQAVTLAQGPLWIEFVQQNTKVEFR